MIPPPTDRATRLAQIEKHLQTSIPVGLRRALQRERARLLKEQAAAQKGGQVS